MHGGRDVAHAQVEVGHVVARLAAFEIPAPQYVIDPGRNEGGVVSVVGVVHGDDVGHERGADIGVEVGDGRCTTGGLEQEAGVAEKGQPGCGASGQGRMPESGGDQPRSNRTIGSAISPWMSASLVGKW